MRKLTRDLKIALEFVSAAAAIGNKPLSTAIYAKATSTPLFFLQQIARRLRMQGVLTAKRQRGYILNPDATLLDVFKALDSIGIVNEMLVLLPNINAKIAEMRF